MAERWAERRPEPRSIKDGHAQGARAPSSCLLPLGSLSLLPLGSLLFSLGSFLLDLSLSSSSLALPLPLRSSALAVVEAESFLVLVLRSRLGGPPVHGGTDGRRGSAGGVVDLRVWARSAGEGSQTARGVGARRDHTDGRGREDSTVPKGSRDSFSFSLGFLCK